MDLALHFYCCHPSCLGTCMDKGMLYMREDSALWVDFWEFILIGRYIFKQFQYHFFLSPPPTSALDYTGKTSDIREYSFLVLSE